MGQKTIANLGKWGFNLILIFGLLHYDPISNVLAIDIKLLGLQLNTLIKVVTVCMFFGCVMFAGDEVIANAEKNSGKIVKIFIWVSDIMSSVKASIKKKSDE
jgi:hypothetical protein